MSTTLREKANAILENSDFSDLPYEERKRISRYMAEVQISTVMEVLDKNLDLTCEAWRDRVSAWLATLIVTYRREWGE